MTSPFQQLMCMVASCQIITVVKFLLFSKNAISAFEIVAPTPSFLGGGNGIYCVKDEKYKNNNI
jgi:hypothetical protein